MFTGLVQKKGIFKKLAKRDGGAYLVIECSPWENGVLVKGESVAVQGACLTVVDFSDKGFTVDVLDETLRCTNLSQLKIGESINLERALRLCDRLGGHLVSGHVDGQGRVESITQTGRDYCMRIACNATEMRYIVKKGSICIDGISLTVSDVPSDLTFEVCIIPTTWQDTSLSRRRVGECINLETDLIGRYVERFTQVDASASAKPSLSLEQLIQSGF